MNNRRRFFSVFHFQPVDRLPLYYYGTWTETKQRWASEGLQGQIDYLADAGPQLPDMDPDWEYPMWGCHGLVHCGLIGNLEPIVLEETEDYVIRRNEVGEVSKISKIGSSVSEVLQYALEPNRKSWENFKRYLDPEDPRRRPAGWQERADRLMQEDRVLAYFGGSLYGLLRNWMGIENISCLMYDDEELLAEMTDYLCRFHMALLGPVLRYTGADLIYLYEDCCGADGPLFSPNFLDTFYGPRYRELIHFYRDCGAEFILLDSDGNSDLFVPHWRDYGVDIIFPLEVGKWGANAHTLREKYGQDLCFMGGVDKHIICQGEEKIYEHLMALKQEVDKGGYLPIPDHRIPPECSLQDMQTYNRVFRQVFGGTPRQSVEPEALQQKS